jgi:tetratricopeptide (TPR) repeat protein
MFERRWMVDSSAVGAYINYAQCMIVLERFEQASAALVQAISRNPDYVPAYTNLGIAYLQMKDYAKARSTFEHAVKVVDTNVVKYRKDLAQAHRYIGLALMLDKKWPEAIESLKKSLEFDAKDENTLLWMGQALQNGGKWEEAVKYYKDVLKVNKNNELAQKGLKDLEGK